MKLKKPVKHGTETITEINLRQPMGKEIRKIGTPVNALNGKADLDDEKIAQYIIELGAVPSSVVDALWPQDFMALSMEVIGFLTE